MAAQTQPQTQGIDPSKLTEFRSFVLQQNPNISKSQLSQLDNFIAKKQREELARQGVLSLDDIAKTDPGSAVRLLYEGVKPGQSLDADTRKQMAKKEGLIDSLNVLESNLNQVSGMARGGPVRGGISSLLGTLSGGNVFPEATDYEALRKSMIGPVARIVSQEAGVLTDRDIARAENLLPKLGDSETLVQNKLRNLRILIGEGENTTQSSGRFTIEQVE